MRGIICSADICSRRYISQPEILSMHCRGPLYCQDFLLDFLTNQAKLVAPPASSAWHCTVRPADVRCRLIKWCISLFTPLKTRIARPTGLHPATTPRFWMLGCQLPMLMCARGFRHFPHRVASLHFGVHFAWQLLRIPWRLMKHLFLRT